MIKDLIKLANHLDKKGFAKEADLLDNVIRKMSQMEMESKGGLSASEEGRMLSGVKFSPVSAEDKMNILKYIEDRSIPNGSYGYNNGSYVVYPYNYPDIDIMFYYKQPGRETRQFGGDSQSYLEEEISKLLKENKYLNKDLPVPFSTGITPSSELFGKGPTEREKALIKQIRENQDREFYEFADPRRNMLVNPEVNMPRGYMLTEDKKKRTN